MKSIDIIMNYLDKNGITQSKAAKMAGMSKQNFWDKLNKGNPRFNSMERIMQAFGFEIRIQKADGAGLDFDEQGFLQTLRNTNLCVDAIEEIIKSMGYVLKYIEKSGAPTK